MPEDAVQALAREMVARPQGAAEVYQKVRNQGSRKSSSASYCLAPSGVAGEVEQTARKFSSDPRRV